MKWPKFGGHETTARATYAERNGVQNEGQGAATSSTAAGRGYRRCIQLNRPPARVVKACEAGQRSSAAGRQRLLAAGRELWCCGSEA